MNKFEEAVHSLIGKTISDTKVIQVGYMGDVIDAIKLSFSDGTDIKIGCEPDDIDFIVLDEANSEEVTWTCSYSPRRDEVYILAFTGEILFTIPPEEVPHGIAFMDNETLRRWVKSDCSDILGSLGLLE